MVVQQIGHPVSETYSSCVVTEWRMELIPHKLARTEMNLTPRLGIWRSLGWTINEARAYSH